MTIKQELRSLTAERKRLMKRITRIDIREGQLLARLNVESTKSPRKKGARQ